MDRKDEGNSTSGKLFHQILVDGWTIIPSNLVIVLLVIVLLRAEKYVNLQGAVTISDGPFNIVGR